MARVAVDYGAVSAAVGRVGRRMAADAGLAWCVQRLREHLREQLLNIEI
jgi:hypothetical protein